MDGVGEAGSSAKRGLRGGSFKHSDKVGMKGLSGRGTCYLSVGWARGSL